MGETAAMMMAEWVVLASLRADGATIPPTGWVGIDVSAHAALVAELVEQGHVTLPRGRVAFAGSSPDEPFLQKTFAGLQRFEGKKVSGYLAVLHVATRRRLVDRMVDDGRLVLARRSVLPDRWRPADPTAAAALRADLRSAALDARPLDDRTVIVLGLLGSSRSLEGLFPDGADLAQAKARIAEGLDRHVLAPSIGNLIDASSSAIRSGTRGPVP